MSRETYSQYLDFLIKKNETNANAIKIIDECFSAISLKYKIDQNHLSLILFQELYKNIYYPKYQHFPITKKLNTVNNYLNNISKSQLNKDNLINVSYNDFLTTLNFETTEDKIYLCIKNKNNNANHLDLIITKSSAGNLDGFLDYISSNIYSENIPKEKAGTWLVNLSIAICKSLGLKTMSLVDRSYIQRKAKNVNLLFLRIFQGKFSSWYTQFGFILKKKPNIQKQLIDDMKSLYSLDIEEFRFDLLFEYMNANVFYKNETLGKFMVYLWENNKNHYIQAFEHIYKKQYGSFNLINKIRKISSTEYILYL